MFLTPKPYCLFKDSDLAIFLFHFNVLLILVSISFTQGTSRAIAQILTDNNN